MPKAKKVAPPGRNARSGRDLPSGQLPTIIGGNLKSLRIRQGYSLERMSALSSVSRGMLGQIENGQSVPTVSLLLKIANALAVPLAALVAVEAPRGTTALTRSASKVLSSSGGRFTLRLLFPSGLRPSVELYDARIAAQHRELLDVRLVGAMETFAVLEGRVELTVGHEAPVVLAEGDGVRGDY